MDPHSAAFCEASDQSSIFGTDSAGGNGTIGTLAGMGKGISSIPARTYERTNGTQFSSLHSPATAIAHNFAVCRTGLARDRFLMVVDRGEQNDFACASVFARALKIVKTITHGDVCGVSCFWSR